MHLSILGFVLILLALALTLTAAPLAAEQPTQDKQLYTVTNFTPPESFTTGIEGPAVDRRGNIYAVNYQHQHTIGIVTPQGQPSIFITLPDNSIGNGIRFNSTATTMFIADYTNHNILAYDMNTAKLHTFAHNPDFNQPNDIAIADNNTLFASDPNWANSTGQIWRIDTDGSTHLLESNMGTANGIEVSPDNKTLYVNESAQRNVWAYDLSSDNQISNKRLLISFPDFGLDGMRTDAQGNLYIARHGKGVIAIVSPQGKLLREVPLLGKLPTNIAFGGPDGKTCYVTVADTQNIQTFRTDTPGRAFKIFNP